MIRFKNLLDEFADAINQLSPIGMPSNFLCPYCDYSKESALNYSNKFDKNCSYTDLINIFDNFYSDFLITMFNIGSDELILNNNMLNDFN